MLMLFGVFGAVGPLKTKVNERKRKAKEGHLKATEGLHQSFETKRTLIGRVVFSKFLQRLFLKRF